MAVLDDQTWLLAFIRNQFIISDDTGICETVLGPELEPKEYESVPSSSFLGASTSSQNHNNGEKRLRERALSPDIVLEVDSRVSRRRSNTAVRLEKIRKERDEKGRVTTVRWRARPAGTPRRSALLQTQQSVEELNAAFAQVEVKRQNSSVQRPKSLLSATLEADEARGSRQRFEEYAKFDGYMQRNGKTFMVYIHLPDTPGETPPALSVCVLENTKFSDLIGLVCLRWTQANGEPALKDDVAHYTLLFAEDNGDIDRDIPSIELSEPVGKYGASALAFVENDDPTARGAAERVVVKVNLVEGSFSKFVFDTADIPLGAVLEKVLRKRKMIPKVRGLEYTLEKAGHPGIALDLNQTLSSVRVREFWMVRINSAILRKFLPLYLLLWIVVAVFIGGTRKELHGFVCGHTHTQIDRKLPLSILCLLETLCQIRPRPNSSALLPRFGNRTRRRDRTKEAAGQRARRLRRKEGIDIKPNRTMTHHAGSSSASTNRAVRALMQEFQSIQKEPVEGFKVKLLREDNLFDWEVAIFGPPGTLYEGGYFKAHMKFPADYPYSPPSIRFLSKIWHPNVYENGDLCISILHAPGDDPHSGELPSERWNPTQNVRTILMSVISLLNEPNTSSPANVDASVMFRRWRDSNSRDSEYEQIVRSQVNQTMAEAVRDGVKVPTTVEDYCVRTVFTEQKPAVPEMLMDTSDFYYSDDSDQDNYEYPDEESDAEAEDVDMTPDQASSSSSSPSKKTSHHLPPATDATKTPNRD